MRVLVIDVGGTNVKVAGSWRRTPVRIESGPELTAALMVRHVRALTVEWKYDAVSLGYPGPVRRGVPIAEPHNLGGGWVRYNFERAFGAPVRIINDAAMQALAATTVDACSFWGWERDLAPPSWKRAECFRSSSPISRIGKGGRTKNTSGPVA